MHLSLKSNVPADTQRRNCLHQAWCNSRSFILQFAHEKGKLQALILGPKVHSQGTPGTMSKLQMYLFSCKKKNCLIGWYTSECTSGSNCLPKDQQCSLPSSVRAQGNRLNWLFKPLTISRKSAVFTILKLNIWLKDLLFYDFYNNSEVMSNFILSPSKKLTSFFTTAPSALGSETEKQTYSRFFMVSSTLAL